MRNLKLHSVFLTIFFVLLQSCTKDNPNEPQVYRSSPLTSNSLLQNENSVIINFDDDKYLRDGQSVCHPITRKLAKNTGLYDKVQRHLRNYRFKYSTEIDKILAGTVISSLSNEKEIIQHSILFDIKYGSISRYIIVESTVSGEVVSDAVIITYLTPGFLQATSYENIDLKSHVNAIKIYNAKKYLEGSGRNPCPETTLEECYNITFGTPTGGGGGGTSNGDAGPGDGSTGSGDGGTGSTTSSDGTGPGAGGTGGGGGGSAAGRPCNFGWVKYTVEKEASLNCGFQSLCVGDSWEQFEIDCSDDLFNGGSTAGGRDLTDCQMILISTGIMSNLELASARLTHCTAYDEPSDLDCLPAGVSADGIFDEQFCENWNRFMENCLTETQGNIIEQWAPVLMYSPTIFNTIIQKDKFCKTADKADELVTNLIWLNYPENGATKQHIETFLNNHPNDIEAILHVNNIMTNMRMDADFNALVTSSFGWSGIMWEIAKELVGDKAVDIIINLIPGFGNADELRDAIKAAKNGDWIEFTFEVGKIVTQNTPVGKMLKIADSGAEMYIFCKKIEKIWDKIQTYSSAVVEQMWNIVKNVPKELRTNTALIEGFCKAIKRGVKSIDELENYAQTIGANYINSSTIIHIFRGSNNGGVHHISALVSDPNTYKIHGRVPTSNGCYKAIIYKNGVPMTPDKDFFPDDWDEYKVVEEIKYAWPNKTQIPGDNFAYWGYLTNGQRIKIVLNTNGTIKTCFPQ